MKKRYRESHLVFSQIRNKFKNDQEAMKARDAMDRILISLGCKTQKATSDVMSLKRGRTFHVFSLDVLWPSFAKPVYIKATKRGWSVGIIK